MLKFIHVFGIVCYVAAFWGCYHRVNEQLKSRYDKRLKIKMTTNKIVYCAGLVVLMYTPFVNYLFAYFMLDKNFINETLVSLAVFFEETTWNMKESN